MTGLMTVWADGVPKDLGEGDFAMVPAYHNHTYPVSYTHLTLRTIYSV